jgi:hypothetical protein
MKSEDCLGAKWTCKSCGNEVSEYLCNQSLLKLRPESCNWDYWVSCGNILCKNHYGSGVFQQNPDWVEK